VIIINVLFKLSYSDSVCEFRALCFISRGVVTNHTTTNASKLLIKNSSAYTVFSVRQGGGIYFWYHMGRLYRDTVPLKAKMFD